MNETGATRNNPVKYNSQEYGKIIDALNEVRWGNRHSINEIRNRLPDSWDFIVDAMVKIDKDLLKTCKVDRHIAFTLFSTAISQKLSGMKVDIYDVIEDWNDPRVRQTFDENPDLVPKIDMMIRIAEGEAPEQDWRPDETIPEDYYARNNPGRKWMTVELMNRFVSLARKRGVSAVARGSGGFVPTYRRAGSPSKMSDHWVEKRAGFIARHVAQGKKEGWWKNGEPTRRHLALIMWAYTPTPQKTLAYANRHL